MSPASGRTMRSPSTGEVEVPFSAHFHLGRSGRHPDGLPAEGLRMSRPGEDRPFSHLPVMLPEVTRLLVPIPDGVVLDATVGAGGHAAALLAARPGLRVVGIDQDPGAVAAAEEALAGFGRRAQVERARFDRFGEVLERLEVDRLSGALFDLGVSSPQLDRPERGFSYRNDGPLDMRMDPDQRRTAAEVINHLSEAELAHLFAANGEQRFSRRIARAIVAARPLVTTGQLADVVRSAIPAAARRTGGHPARRVFQAIRIAVNDELMILPDALDAALDRLAPAGRCVVLAYHSGEDRIVKDRFRVAATGGCVCPPGLPCACGAVPVVRLLFRGARKPSADEVALNPRAESARLRAVERLTLGGGA
jgi:16S rRNA (cytosine1402-N4)-methyltransferase